MKKSTQGPPSPSAHYQQELLRELGYPREAAAAAPPKPTSTDPCNPQRLFIRANSLDNYLYGITPASKAKGASISYTDDRLAGTQNATINGMVSYVAFRDICPPTPPGDAPFFSGYSIAPFVLGQGNYTQPKLKTEHSALQFGVENQFEISRSWLPRQVFTIAPYVQTDYRDLARAEGVKVYWDPYDADLHLGGYIDTNPYLGWFVQLRGEADAIDVNSVGVTNLTKTNYDWVGGTAALNMYFLPSDPNVPDWIRNRFAFYATASYFTDARSGRDIHYYTAKTQLQDHVGWLLCDFNRVRRWYPTGHFGDGEAVSSELFVTPTNVMLGGSHKTNVYSKACERDTEGVQYESRASGR